jgi:hypothetical protein
LYLLVTSKGGRCSHYRFFFAGKRKKLSLGTYPEISLECAKARHQYARNVLAQGLDPCEMKATLGKNAFFLRMREWEVAQIRDSSFNTLPDTHQTSRIAATSN